MSIHDQITSLSLEEQRELCDFLSGLVEEAEINQLIDNFSDTLKLRLQQKLSEGKKGWNDSNNADHFIQRVKELSAILHEESPFKLQQYIDMVAYIIFLWNLEIGYKP